MKTKSILSTSILALLCAATKLKTAFQRTIPRMVLSAAIAFSLAAASSTWATTTILSVSQEVYAHTLVENGIGGGGIDGPVNTDTGGLPSFRSVTSSAVTDVGGPAGHTEASAAASQSVGLGGLGWQFSGNVSTHQAGIYPSAQTHAYHYLDFEITDQPETVTLNLTGLSMNGYDAVHLVGFYYRVSNPTTNQVFAYADWITAQTYQLGLAPGSYRLQAGAEIVDNTYAPNDRFASFSDTVGFTNTAPEPSSVLLMVSGALFLFCSRRWTLHTHDRNASP